MRKLKVILILLISLTSLSSYCQDSTNYILTKKVPIREINTAILFGNECKELQVVKDRVIDTLIAKNKDQFTYIEQYKIRAAQKDAYIKLSDAESLTTKNSNQKLSQSNDALQLQLKKALKGKSNWVIVAFGAIITGFVVGKFL